MEEELFSTLRISAASRSMGRASLIRLRSASLSTRSATTSSRQASTSVSVVKNCSSRRSGRPRQLSRRTETIWSICKVWKKLESGSEAARVRVCGG